MDTTVAPITGKYQPLYDHLQRLQVDRWDASFAQVEEILGARLPASARRHRAWWANERYGSHSHARAWMAAGFETSPVALIQERVTFQRLE